MKPIGLAEEDPDEELRTVQYARIDPPSASHELTRAEHWQNSP
jgi:hypothetical protein